MTRSPLLRRQVERAGIVYHGEDKASETSHQGFQVSKGGL